MAGLAKLSEKLDLNELQDGLASAMFAARQLAQTGAMNGRS